MKIQLRDVSPSQLPGILALNQANLPHVGSISMDELVHLFDQAVYFKAAYGTGDELVGFMIALAPTADYGSLNFLWFKAHYDQFAYIDRIAVAPQARRQGLGSQFYQDLEAFAHQRQIPILACEYNLRPPNPKSRAFHRQNGFQEAGIQDTEGGKKTVSLQIKLVN